MKRLKPWIIAAMAAALTLSTIAGVSAQGGPPSLPAFFIGTVTAPEGPVATGLPVVAEIGEKRCNVRDALTFATSSEIRYAAIVDSSNTSAETAGCGVEGASVRFKVGDRYATQTATWSTNPPRQTLNLTLEPLPPPPPPETVTIDVTVWLSMTTGNTYISTRAPGERWVTHNTAVDLSTEHPTHPFFVGSPIPIDVMVGDTTVTIDVTVWLSMRTGNRYISTRAPGERWVTHNTAVDLSTEHPTHPFFVGSPVPIEVDLE